MKKIIIKVLGITAVGLVAAYVVALNISPRISKPPRPAPPNPNGFSILKAVAAKAEIDYDISDALAKKPEKKWTLEEKQALVAKHKTLIEESRNTLRYSYYEPNTMDTFDVGFPHYATFRNVTRILTFAGNVAWEEGKQKEAVDYYLDSMTIGRRIPHQAVLITRLVGIACEAIGRRNLWSRWEQMDGDTAAYAVTRLEALEAEGLPYWKTVEEEKYTILSGTNDRLKHPGKLKADLALDEEDSNPAEDAKLQLYARVVPRVYIINTLNDYLDKVVVQAKKPYIQDHAEIPAPNERFTRSVGDIFPSMKASYVVNETADALLRTTLALRAYHARNGKYPDSLSDLVVAKIIKQIPDDPFALPNTPLQDKSQSGGKYLLYSIGPDGVNDNGKGIEGNNTIGGVPSRVVNLSSKGDMVAGWYTY